jgi:hypothetical protein
LAARRTNGSAPSSKAAAKPKKVKAAPKTDEAVSKLVAIVESQRQLAGESYPVGLARLAELADASLNDTFKCVIGTQGKKVLALSSPATARTKPETLSDALVFLVSDAPGLDLGRVLEVLLAREPRAFSTKELAKAVATPLKPRFVRELASYSTSESLRPGVGCVTVKPAKTAERFFFLAKHALISLPKSPVGESSPASAPVVRAPAGDFESRFEAAFARLDREQGERNYVLLHGLRSLLADVPREQFDAQLMRLRRERRFTLDPSDGRHDRLTQEQLDAGIVEAGNRLVYVAKRTQS